MERKKVLIFETTKTLMRAYELALRGSPWTLIKIQQEGRIFPAIESAAPDAVIVEHRALSGEVCEALGILPLPVIFCAKEKEVVPAGRIHLPRPFSCDELFGALNASLEWTPALVEGEESSFEEGEEGEEEEPLVLTPSDDEEDAPSVVPMEPEEINPLVTDQPRLDNETASAPVPDEFSEDTVFEAKEAELFENLAREEKPAPLLEKVSAEKKETSTMSPSSVEKTSVASFAEQMAERVEERVVEELVPSGVEIPEGAALPEMIRALVRRELREVMKEYFWEEAPCLMRQILEEEIRKIAAKQ